MLTEFSQIKVIQIGCGGIGSWIVIPIYKLLYNFVNAINNNINTQHRVSVTYKIFDDDIIEEQNIKRQNFLKHSLYDFKCRNLGKILQTYIDNIFFSYNIDRIDSIEKLKSIYFPFNELIITIGCVDNVKTRYLIENYLKYTNYSSNSIYIDGGNSIHYGQVITNIYNFDKNGLKNIFKDQDENKNVNFSDIFSKTDREENSNHGCAVFGDQTLGINHMVGSQIILKLQSILIDELITPNYIHFSTSGIAVKM